MVAAMSFRPRILFPVHLPGRRLYCLSPSFDAFLSVVFIPLGPAQISLLTLLVIP